MTEQWKDGDRAVISIPPFEAEYNGGWRAKVDGDLVRFTTSGLTKLAASVERVTPPPVENRGSRYEDDLGYMWAWSRDKWWYSIGLDRSASWSALLSERGPLTEYRKAQP